VKAIHFPIYILSKDDGEVQCFDSHESLARYIEPIDVENGEYEAWDKDGNPMRLGVQKPSWLKIEPAISSSVSLKDALRNYAKANGVQITEGKADSFSEMLRAVESHQRMNKTGLGLLGFFKKNK
jgi:hypothetical protein